MGSLFSATNRVLLAVFAGLAAAESPLPPQPVNINTASVEQLAEIPALKRPQAEMIVRIRERNGPFKAVQELRAVPGVSERVFEKVRKRVTTADKSATSGQKKPPK